MASIDDIGLDVDFNFEDQASSNDQNPRNRAEENTPVRKEDVNEPKPSEFSPSQNIMQPCDSSSESSYEIDAPVGTSKTAAGNDDDDEFDFVITEKETPEIRIEKCEEQQEEREEEKEKPPVRVDPLPSEQNSAAPTAQTSQNEVDALPSSSQVKQETSDAKGDRPNVPDASPIQWKTAEQEWSDVRDVQLDESDDDEDARLTASNTPMISSQEAFNFLKNTDNVLSLYGHQIVTTVQRSGFQAFINALFGPPRLKRHLVQERDVIFSMALHPYDSSNATHFRMLLSVYKSLTGNNLDCPKFGSHWDAIGFQGDDPGTDFRGTGMLGLLCLLNLSCPKAEVGVGGDVGRDERSRLCHQICLSLHRLSQDPEQNFPLAIMSINWTRLLLQTLREGCLNKTLNASCAARGVRFSEAFLELHTAVAYKFLGIWQRGHKTILDSGLVLHDLEEMLRKNAAAVLKEWAAYSAGQSSGQTNATKGRSEPNKRRADRYAVADDGSGVAKDEGVAQLTMLN